MKKAKFRFCVWENEGSFLYETILEDEETGKTYSINRLRSIPPKVVLAWTAELKKKGRMDANEARFVVDLLRARCSRKEA